MYVNLVTADIRHPDSTQIEFVHVKFNVGTPGAIKQDGLLKLRGYDGSVDTSPDTIYSGLGVQTIQVEVTDRDEDRDSGAIDSVQVWTYDVANGDSQQVWLYEIAVSDSVFQGTVDAQYGAGAVDGDGVVAVSVGDTVYASYIDSLDAVGGTSVRLAYTLALGTSGSLEVSYVVQAQDGRGGLRDTVRVRVTDADENQSMFFVDTVAVKMENGSVVESETVDLPETGAGTGVFRDRLPTVSGGAGTNDDGVLVLSTQGTDLDTLLTTYVDTTMALGGSDTLVGITYVVNLFGDVSGNDIVEAFDGHKVLGISVGSDVASFRDSLVADVSGENEILAIDASLILQYRVHIVDAFPVQSYTTLDPKNHPFLKAVGGEMIAFGDAVRQGDGTYLVPMTLADRSGIVSGTFWLSHAPGMEVLGVTTAVGYGDFIVAHNPQSEALRVAFAGAQSSVEGAGEVLWIRVRADEDASLWFGVDAAALNGYRMPMSDVGMFDVSVVEVPETYALHPNVPNPFNPETTIRYDVPSEGRVSLVVYNVMGQTVRVLVDGDQVAGRHEVMWDGRDMLGRDVGSGMYLMRMRADGFADSRKMLLLR